MTSLMNSVAMAFFVVVVLGAAMGTAVASRANRRVIDELRRHAEVMRRIYGADA